MTVGGVGAICRGWGLASGGGVVATGGRMAGGRIGGGGAWGWPSRRRRSSSSQLVGRDAGRGWFMGGGDCGAEGVESSESDGAFFFFSQVATAETTRRTRAVIKESMLRQFYADEESCALPNTNYFGCGPGVPLPPMLSRMPVSAWMFRIR
jgi:hypothetical protein